MIAQRVSALEQACEQLAGKVEAGGRITGQLDVLAARLAADKSSVESYLQGKEEQHVDGTEAVQMHRDLGAKRSLGIHWGTFELTDEPLDEPPQALSKALTRAGVPDEQFFVLALGQTRKLPRRGAVP